MTGQRRSQRPGRRRSHLDTKHPGAFPGVIRTICHGITGAQALISLTIYAALRKHEQIHHPPFSSRILPVQAIAGIGGIFFFAWNFFTWLPVICTESKVLVVLFGIVDAMFTAIMLVALVLQPTYLPLSLKTCHNSESYGVEPGSPSLYMLAAGYNGTMDAAKSDKECHYFISAWALIFVSVVLYSISVVYSLWPVANVLVEIAKTMYRGRRPIAYGKRFFRFMVRIIAALIPRYIKARFRFLRRYVSKSRQQAKVPPKAEKKWSIQYQNPEWNGENLNKVLGFDILMLIARDLHYTDVVNLSMASKTVYNAVFPKAEMYERIKFLRKYTCDRSSHSNCWVCGIQTCGTCSYSRMLHSRSMAKHVETCQPHCSKCYIKVTTQNYWHQGTCDCNGTGFHGTRLANGDIDLHWRLTCEFCFVLNDAEVEQKRKLLQEGTFKRQVQDLEKCSRCIVQFQPGKPKWWVCAGCVGECRSSVHRGWTYK